MSDNFYTIEPNSHNLEIFRRLFELLQLILLEALQDLEHLENLERHLNEIQTWLIRASDILNAPGKSHLPPELAPAALLAMLLKARQRSGLPLEKSKRRKRKTDADRVLERAAQSGVTDFKLDSNADGSATVSIDGIEVELSVTLAKLLSLLADPEIGSMPDMAPPCNGNLVPFKRNQELSSRLQTLLNRRFSPGNLRNLVHRLRRKFAAVGVNKYFIQTAPEGQTRLARKWECAIATH
jgi:hypothetical protein